MLWKTDSNGSQQAGGRAGFLVAIYAGWLMGENDAPGT